MTTLSKTMNDSDWRLAEVEGDPQSAGFVLVRRLEKVDVTSSDSIFTKVNATDTYTTAKADNQSYTGPFLNFRLRPQADDEDAITITQWLVKTRATITDSEWDIVDIKGDPRRSGFTIRREAKYINPYDADTLFVALQNEDRKSVV